MDHGGCSLRHATPTCDRRQTAGDVGPPTPDPRASSRLVGPAVRTGFPQAPPDGRVRTADPTSGSPPSPPRPPPRARPVGRETGRGEGRDGAGRRGGGPPLEALVAVLGGV